MQQFILSCDWGTSSFRLRLVDIQNHQIIGEVLSDRGIAGTYVSWKASCERQEINRENFYLRQLQQEIDVLSNNVRFSLDQIPIVISGMVCSSIGLKELPYAPLPFSLDGSDAIVQRLDSRNGVASDVWLLSGVSNRKDVMRGEETQITGLRGIDSEGDTNDYMVYIFPGTHSKHIKVLRGKIVDFQTYMTGELFHVIKNYTILKDAVNQHDNRHALNQIDIDAFCKGIAKSKAYNLLHTLFSVRINQLFDLLSKQGNFFYLSGLLIGTELRSLCDKGYGRIVLCSGSNVYHLYELAMRELKLLNQTTFVAPDTMDKVVIEGQIRTIQKKSIKATPK